MARVVIHLPGASRFDAEAFGLWVDMLIRNAQADDPGATPVGAITVEGDMHRSSNAGFIASGGGGGGNDCWSPAPDAEGNQ